MRDVEDQAVSIKDTYSDWQDRPGDYERPLCAFEERVNWRRREHALRLMREAAHTIPMAGAHLMAAGCWSDGRSATDTALRVFTELAEIEGEDL